MRSYSLSLPSRGSERVHFGLIIAVFIIVLRSPFFSHLAPLTPIIIIIIIISLHSYMCA